ncbi:TonB-dependent siderophore receptor, partial [Vibrio sinaloensis]
MGRVNLTQLKPTLVYCAIAAAISQPTIAQETSYFDEVLVWGTKVSSNTESIGAQDMSLKQADHMSDLLRDIPGVDVGGTHSVNQRINI